MPAEAYIRSKLELVMWHNLHHPDCAPPSPKTVYMLMGASGYGARKFVVLGYFDPEYRSSVDGQIRWLGVDNEDLMDNSWRPSWYAEPIWTPEP